MKIFVGDFFFNNLKKSFVGTISIKFKVLLPATLEQQNFIEIVNSFLFIVQALMSFHFNVLLKNYLICLASAQYHLYQERQFLLVSFGTITTYSSLNTKYFNESQNQQNFFISKLFLQYCQKKLGQILISQKNSQFKNIKLF